MWQLVQSELRYQGKITLPVYAVLALVYALIPSARLAYVLMLIPVVLMAVVIFKRNSLQKWERRSILLPVPPLVVFRARLSSQMILATGAIVVVGTLLLRDVYASLHPVLTWRLLSTFNIVALAMIAMQTLADIKTEHENNWTRYIYPALIQLLWLLLYLMFIDNGAISTLYEIVLPPGYQSEHNLLFETPTGVAVIAALNMVVLYISWLIFKNRTSFTCK